MFPKGLLDFIKHWEGCRLKAYADQGGKITIGWGHTGDVQITDNWVQAQADEQLEHDVSHVIARIKPIIKAPINDNQLSALTSFTYNLGYLNLTRSGLLKYLNLRQYEKASDQFPLWNHIGMYVSPGLTARRAAERDLFLKKDS